MNNLEWLIENDRETLLTMTAGDCDNCKFDNDCWNGSIYRCGRDWLEAEYIEPDNWYKIEHDAMRGLNWYWDYISSGNAFSAILRQQKISIVM